MCTYHSVPSTLLSALHVLSYLIHTFIYNMITMIICFDNEKSKCRKVKVVVTVTEQNRILSLRSLASGSLL